MPGRYSDAQRAQIRANRRERAAGQRYGFSLADQGYRDAKDQGQAAYALDRFHSAFGGGADPTWHTRIGPNGEIQYKARAENPDRVKDTGGGWFTAPEHVQRRYQNYKNSGAENIEQFRMQRGLNMGLNSGKYRNAGNGTVYDAAGNAFDASSGQRLGDDAFNAQAAAGLFGGNYWDRSMGRGMGTGAPQAAPGAPMAPAASPAAPAAPAGQPVDLSNILQRSPTVNQGYQGSNFGQQPTDNPFSAQGVVPQQNSDLMQDPFGLKKRKTALPGMSGASLGSDF